jgi:hypothetical protein
MAAHSEQYLKRTPRSWKQGTMERFNTLLSYLQFISLNVFIDDLSFKNIIIKNGQLNGIIDVDWLFSGDLNFYLSKIAVECLIKNIDMTCIVFFSSELGTRYHRHAFEYYTILSCFEVLYWENRVSTNSNYYSESAFRRDRAYLEHSFAQTT